MLQTLFTIPHEIAGLPVFGLGWMLMIWAVLSVVIVAGSVRRSGFGKETVEWLWLLAVAGIAVGVVMPFLEADDPLNEGQKLGLSIRGYGVMMLLGVVTGVGMAIQRGRRMGYHPDMMLSLCVWMFVAGIVGARVFYTIQYWSEFNVPGDTLGTLANVVRFTEGGLVVYGSVIGAVGAAFVFAARHRIPTLEIGDIIAPAMLAGLALGRIGCLFNGCCWGGVCEAPLPSVQFSIGARPYMAQLETGRLLGLRLETVEGSEAGYRVVAIDEDSPWARQSLKQGDVIVNFDSMSGDELKHRRQQATKGDQSETPSRGPQRSAVSIKTSDGRLMVLTPEQLPARSRPVHPTQLYAAINAALLMLLMYAYFPYRKHNGEVFALTMTLYPITRSLLELIRNDEQGQLGTALTISQWISVFMLLAIVALWVHIMRQPRLDQSDSARSPTSN